MIHQLPTWFAILLVVSLGIWGFESMISLCRWSKPLQSATTVALVLVVLVVLFAL